MGCCCSLSTRSTCRNPRPTAPTATALPYTYSTPYPMLAFIYNIATTDVFLCSYSPYPCNSNPMSTRDVHRNFEGPLLCPGKKGQHVHFCNRHHHAPSPWTHILPISLKTLKWSGSITNRHRYAPSPRAHIPRLHEVLQP